MIPVTNHPMMGMSPTSAKIANPTRIDPKYESRLPNTVFEKLRPTSR